MSKFGRNLATRHSRRIVFSVFKNRQQVPRQKAVAKKCFHCREHKRRLNGKPNKKSTLSCDLFLLLIVFGIIFKGERRFKRGCN